MKPGIDTAAIVVAADMLSAAHAALTALNADGVLRAKIMYAEARLRGALMAALPDRIDLRDAA